MSGKRVLIVDDEAPMRFLLGKQLTRAGFVTATAADGEAAQAALASESFDAIVLDVIMPGMDGFELCRRLKADERTAGIPVIFLSASCSGEFRRRAFSVGAADFLAKPFQTAELPAYLGAILRRSSDPTPADGRLTTSIGASQIAGAASFATRLAEVAALEGPAPVMLIDLELPAGSIGARLQLAGGPNMRVLLQDTGEPVNADQIARVAQRYHSAMEVIPAPFSPATINQGEPQPHRLEAVLDGLLKKGYHIIIHLGTGVNELTRIALHRSETVWLAATSDDHHEREALLEAILAAGVPQARVRAAVDGQIAEGQTVDSQTGNASGKMAGRGRNRSGRREQESSAGQLMPAI